MFVLLGRLCLPPALVSAVPAALPVLATTALFAADQVLTRRLAWVDDVETTVFHTAIAAGALATLAVPVSWAARAGGRSGR